MNNMSQDDFEKLVKKAEREAETNIKTYKTKVFLYSLLGYAFIFFLLLLLFGLSAAIVGTAFLNVTVFLILVKKKLIFVALPMIWILFKALWVRIEQPQGYELTKKKFPVLFKELEALRKQLHALKIHNVILTPEFNAAVIQIPRFGLFGTHKNTLILGLELLLTLSPEQARAVVAHEFGHLSGEHGHLGGWIYRVRTTWMRLLNVFQHSDSWGAGLMYRFFNWYSPKFSAYSFVLARTNEYEADKLAAEITSSSIIAEALINTYVTSNYADESYWKAYFKKADNTPEPEHPPWQGLHQFVNQCILSKEDYSKKLQEVLAIETNYYDTHPSLKERLSALNTSPEIPEVVKKTAAEVWFDKEFDAVLSEFDQGWLKENTEKWKERYDYVFQSKQKLEQLAKRKEDMLSDDELWEKATLTQDIFGNNEKVMPILQNLQKRLPEAAGVAFELGKIYFENNDERLLEQMKIAMVQPNLKLEACQYAYHYLSTQENKEEELKWWENEYNRHNERLIAAENERAELTDKDEIEKAALDETAKAKIIEQLKQHKNVGQVWIAQKKLRHFPEHQALAFVIKLKGFIINEQKKLTEIMQSLQLENEYFVITKSGDFKKLAKRIIKTGEKLL